MPTLATLIEILSTSLWAHFKSFGYFIEKNRKQVFSGHCLGSRMDLLDFYGNREAANKRFGLKVYGIRFKLWRF